MSALSSTGREVAKGTGIFIEHLAVALLGVFFMIIGSAMRVSLVLLPIGIPLGLAGLALFLWGLFGWACREEESTASYKVWRDRLVICADWPCAEAAPKARRIRTSKNL